MAAPSPGSELEPWPRLLNLPHGQSTPLSPSRLWEWTADAASVQAVTKAPSPTFRAYWPHSDLILLCQGVHEILSHPGPVQRRFSLVSTAETGHGHNQEVTAFLPNLQPLCMELGHMDVSAVLLSVSYLSLRVTLQDEMIFYLGLVK